MNPPLTTTEAAVLLLVAFVAFMGLLVLMAAPMEAMARRSPRFAERVDALVDRIFG
jgi:hypothetical protein